MVIYQMHDAHRFGNIHNGRERERERERGLPVMISFKTMPNDQMSQATLAR